MRPEPEVLLVTTDVEASACEVALQRAADAAGMSVRRIPAPSWGGLGAGSTAVSPLALGAAGAVERTAAMVLSAEALTAAAGSDRPSVPARASGAYGVPVAVLAAAPDDPRTLRAALASGASAVMATDDDLGLLEWLRSARDVAGCRAAPSGRIVTVRPMTGGAGASCLAVALAREAGRTGAAALVDADPGGGVELLLGEPWSGGDAGETVAGWTRLGDLDGQVDPVLLRERLPSEGSLRVVGHGAGSRMPPPRARLDLVVSGLARDGGLVVVDLPSGIDAAAAAAESGSWTGVPGGPSGHVDDELWVVPCTVPGVESAARQLRGAARETLVASAWTARGEMPARRWLVARRARAGLHPEEVADALGLPLAASVAYDRRLDEHVALGLGVAPRRRSAYARAARCVVDALQLAEPGTRP